MKFNASIKMKSGQQVKPINFLVLSGVHIYNNSFKSVISTKYILSIVETKSENPFVLHSRGFDSTKS